MIRMRNPNVSSYVLGVIFKILDNINPSQYNHTF